MSAGKKKTWAFHIGIKTQGGAVGTAKIGRKGDSWRFKKRKKSATDVVEIEMCEIEDKTQNYMALKMVGSS